MEVFFSVFLSELTTRLVSFFISKFSKQMPRDMEDRLHKVLLRAQVILDEAMGRRITNQAMLLQLDMLRDAIHRGYYRLDNIRSQSHEDTIDKFVRQSSSFSTVNSRKGWCLSSKNAEVLNQLQETIEDLCSMIADLKELVIFLTSYPRLYCEPYSMHLQLANSMFGRQMETELVLNFLLHLQPQGVEELDVMPIVGPGQVGKSTLVAHVSRDERVRAHFSEILFFHIQGFADDDLAAFVGECELKLQNRMSKSKLEGRLLIVVELTEDLSEDSWSKLYSASKQYAPKGSKIIVTSRFDNIVKFGTTQALTLKYPSNEAYWYFFKTLTFGSMDPEMHPKLMHLAMEIARTQRQSLLGANVLAHFLRDNFDVHFWCKVLAFLRGSFQKHVSSFGEHPIDLLYENRPAHFRRMAVPSEGFVVYHWYQCSSEEEVPSLRSQDVLYGSVKVHGKFEVLVWSSRIPPFYSYVLACEIQELKTRAVKRKRSMKNRVTLC